MPLANYVIVGKSTGRVKRNNRYDGTETKNEKKRKQKTTRRRIILHWNCQWSVILSRISFMIYMFCMLIWRGGAIDWNRGKWGNSDRTEATVPPRKIGLILFYNGPLSGKPRLEKRAYRSPVSNRYSTPTGESARTLYTHRTRATILWERRKNRRDPSI